MEILTHFSDAILICLIALGFIGAVLTWWVLVLLRGPGTIESSQLTKIPFKDEFKKNFKTKNESLDLAINKSKPLEGLLDDLRTEKNSEIKKLNDRIVELESLPGQLKKRESSMTDVENQLRQRTASFKKQVKSFQARIRELEPMKQLAEERLVSLNQLKESFHSYRMGKEGEISALKQNLTRLEHLQEIRTKN